MLLRLSPRIMSNIRFSSVNSLKGLDSVQVGYMNENCILVNEEDSIMRDVSKVEAHSVSTMQLHRAFSVFAFTPQRKLLLQKRSSTKITFPGLWTNTCCSHPLFNKDEVDGIVGVKNAASRKMLHELGVEGVKPKEFVFKGKYLYKAHMTDSPWGEHEMDYALVLRDFDVNRLNLNPEEVEDVMEVTPDELAQQVEENKIEFTPWFNLFYRLEHLQNWWKIIDHIEEDKPSIIRMN